MQPLPYIFSPHADSPQVRHFGALVAKEFRIPRQLGEIMYHRGLRTLEAVQAFLYPQLSMLPSPDSMKGIGEAVDSIVHACTTASPIFIHGDYDVDGITATALLTVFFNEIGIDTHYYIPNRLEERYGLSVRSIDRLLAQSREAGRGGLLITVDCGISAVREVAYARERGLVVIITDHHEPQATLPCADALLNPKQHDCRFPFSQLSGVGVAFFLIVALRKAFMERGLFAARSLNLKKYLDLVALGTVADVVPLVGVNRILVRAGLEVLSAKNRPGLLSLCECCGIGHREILAEDISFKLAPRINAAGRLGVPRLGVELLLAKDHAGARRAADELERLNTARKQLEGSALAAIEQQCAHQVEAGVDGLAVYHADCHPGVLGILASKIVERFHRPAIIFTDDQQHRAGTNLKGSGRSVAGVHLFHLLEQCNGLIDQFGGHAMAVGLTIDKTLLPSFTDLFNRQVTTRHAEVLRQGRGIVIDCHLTDKSILTMEFAWALRLLQPFGEGNPEPTFLLSREQLVQPKGVNGHLRFQLRGANGHVFPGIGFRLAPAGRNFHGSQDLVFHLKRSWFRGTEQTQIQALHLVPH